VKSALSQFEVKRAKASKILARLRTAGDGKKSAVVAPQIPSGVEGFPAGAAPELAHEV
jgi:hypothetical protein